MRKRLNDPDQSTEVDMTPMLDIVFIMLIFFIVTTSFVKESGIEVNRPTNSETKPELDQKALVIEINQLEDISIAGRLILQNSVRANIEAALSSRPNLLVLIKVDDSVDTGILVDVVDQVKLAGITQVTVSRISG